MPPHPEKLMAAAAREREAIDRYTRAIEESHQLITRTEMLCEQAESLLVEEPLWPVCQEPRSKRG